MASLTYETRNGKRRPKIAVQVNGDRKMISLATRTAARTTKRFHSRISELEAPPA